MSRPRHHISCFGVVALSGLFLSPPASAQVSEKSCDAFLLAPRQVKGKAAGPKSCLMQETSATYDGRALTRLDVGLDGTVDGYLAKIGNYKEYFSNSPELVSPQTWGPREVFFGVAAYERAKGASMTIVFPRDRTAWNGKLWVTAHGRGFWANLIGGIFYTIAGFFVVQHPLATGAGLTLLLAVAFLFGGCRERATLPAANPMHWCYC